MPHQGYTDAQLKLLVSHPDWSERDAALLTADERQRLQTLAPSSPTTTTTDTPPDQSWLLDLVSGAGNVALGGVKGAGQTGEDAFNLAGRAASATTGQPYEPEANPWLEATTPGQRAGKAGEQISEYFIPSGVGGFKAITGAARALGPKLPAQLTRLKALLTGPNLNAPARKAVQTALARLSPTRTARTGALATRTAGEFGKAAGVSALHGESEPEVEATIAGAGVPAAAGTTAALRSPIVQNLLAILGAGAPAGLGTTGLASRMGTFGVIKRLLAEGLASQAVQRGAGRMVTGAARVGAGATEQARQARREREER